MLDFILGSAFGHRGYYGYGEETPRTSSARGQNVAAMQMQHLVRENDELRLVCAAIWSVMKKRTGCTDEELVAAIEGADARDGTKDGKITTVKTACPKCGRSLLTKRRDLCSWCGEPTGLTPV